MFDPKGPSFAELTRQALSETTRGYDLLATKFEYTPFRTPDELLEPMLELIGGPRSIGSALDVCCGTGAAMSKLRAMCTDHVMGIDLSQGMLDEAARQLAEAPGDAEVRLERQDVLEMDFHEEFDVITCCGAFGHILHHQQDEFLHRVREALVPGGKFVFITHLMPQTGSTPWLAARGFNAVMHVRNALLKPPFIMFYLTFPLERAVDMLGKHDFAIEVHSPYKHMSFGRAMRVVVATRK